MPARVVQDLAVTDDGRGGRFVSALVPPIPLVSAAASGNSSACGPMGKLAHVERYRRAGGVELPGGEGCVEGQASGMLGRQHAQQSEASNKPSKRRRGVRSGEACEEPAAAAPVKAPASRAARPGAASAATALGAGPARRCDAALSPGKSLEGGGDGGSGGTQVALQLRFTLAAAAFATSLLREVTAPPLSLQNMLGLIGHTMDRVSGMYGHRKRVDAREGDGLPAPAALSPSSRFASAAACRRVDGPGSGAQT